MLVITYFEPNGTTRTLNYNKSSVMIGRAPGNDLSLEEVKGVSRYHARLYVEGDDVVIQDLNSTNGTYVNKVKIETSVVSPRDTITVGDATFKVVYERSKSSSADSLMLLDSLSPENGHHESAFQPESEPLVEAFEQEVDLHSDCYWTSLGNFLNPVWPYVLDESVREVMINGPKEIFFERDGKLHRSDRSFTEAELKAALQNISQYTGRKLQEHEAYFEARLPDGSRVTVLLPPYSVKGISMTIRKFNREALTAERWLELGSISKEILLFLSACVQLKKNIIVSGPTAGGKTSLLNILCNFVPRDERVVTIEDFSELELPEGGNVLPLETRPREKKVTAKPPIEELFRTALRMRPDRMVVGELRGSETLDLLQAMTGGQAGSMSTIYALSPLQALRRIETLAYSNEHAFHQRAVREKMCDAIDLIVQTYKLPDQSRRVTQVTEVRGVNERGEYDIVDVFRFTRRTSGSQSTDGDCVATGYIPEIAEEMRTAGMKEALSLFL